MPDYSMAPGRTPTDGGFAGFRLADADVDDGEGAYREEATRSARVAAVVMVAATLIGLITTLQGNDAGGAAQSLVSPRNLIMAVVFDVMIAFWIWNGRRGAIGLAAVRLVAGAFLLTPGFLTDTLGLVLFVPAARRTLRSLFWHYGVRSGRIRAWVDGRPPSEPDGPIIDGEYEDMSETGRSGGKANPNQIDRKS